MVYQHKTGAAENLAARRRVLIQTIDITQVN
jgi:hypothetical protein